MSAPFKRIRLYLVEDSTPDIVLEARDRITGVPLDISAGATVARLKVRLAGASTNKADIVCTKLAGQVLANGQVSYDAPYDVLGFGGRCMASCDATVFDAPGQYLAQLQVTNGAGEMDAPAQLLDIDVSARY